MRWPWVALHNYHDSYNTLPMGAGGTSGAGWNVATHNSLMLDVSVVLLPYMEQAALYDIISSPQTIGGVTYPAFGPAANWAAYTPWDTQVPGLLCPSDGEAHNKPAADNGRSNYHGSRGDTIRGNGQGPCRGVLGYQSKVAFRDITDGTSNTLAVAERLFAANASLARRIKVGVADLVTGIEDNPTLCKNTEGADGLYNVAVRTEFGRYWAFGFTYLHGITTVLPPNAPSCLHAPEAGGTWGDGIFSPTSNHPGGVNGVLCDGSVRFFSETINTGNIALPEAVRQTPQAIKSPYGVWGALGSRAGGE